MRKAVDRFGKPGTGSCEEIGCDKCTVALTPRSLSACDMNLVECGLQFDFGVHIRNVLSVSEFHIGFAAYAEPSCEVVAKARPSSFHRHF